MKCVSCLPATKLWAVVLAVCVQIVSVANADPINESIDASKLGVTPNFACGGHGACGAVAALNSFKFLEKQYPSIYDNKLTPNDNATANTDQMDAQKFGFDGWQVGSNPMRMGYYNRTGGAELDFLNTKKDWINDYAPGTTVFNSWWATPAGHPEWASPDHANKPTVADLAAELHDKEDVEFFVQGDNFYHVMTLTGISCDMAMNCTIKWQDPNDPAQMAPNQTMAKEYSAPITITDGMIMFGGVLGAAGNVTMTAAFAESPNPTLIPEPATVRLLALGAFGLLIRGRRPVR
jgi:hypothetical protein